MPRTLFAFCKQDGQNVVRRVPLEAGVQGEVEAIFDEQERPSFAERMNPSSLMAIGSQTAMSCFVSRTTIFLRN